MKNFNITNVGILLLGVLLVLSAYYNKPVTDIVKAVLKGDLAIFAGANSDVKPGQEATGSSSGQSGFDGNGGFVGGPAIGSW